MDALMDTEEMVVVSEDEQPTDKIQHEGSGKQSPEKMDEPSGKGDPAGDLLAKLWKVEHKLKQTEEALQKELRRNKLPDANELAALRQRVAEFEAKQADDRPAPEKTGPECLFGWYPRFNSEKGREDAAADISTRLADGWEIAQEELKDTTYIVRFTRGKRNNPYGTALTRRRDRSEMNWNGVMAAM